jgi:hypothetical protein
MRRLLNPMILMAVVALLLACADGIPPNPF